MMSDDLMLIDRQALEVRCGKVDALLKGLRMETLGQCKLFPLTHRHYTASRHTSVTSDCVYASTARWREAAKREAMSRMKEAICNGHFVVVWSQRSVDGC